MILVHVCIVSYELWLWRALRTRERVHDDLGAHSRRLARKAQAEMMGHAPLHVSYQTAMPSGSTLDMVCALGAAAAAAAGRTIA